MRVKPRVMALDMDGVLIEERSSWSVLHELLGSYKLVSERKDAERFARGEISYEEWMRRDTEAMVKAWGRCLHRDELLNMLASRVRIRKGVKELIRAASRCGLITAVVSGGISLLARYLGELLGVDYVYANELIFNEDGCLVPGGVGVVNPLRKCDVLAKISVITGNPLSSFIYVGDSAWDLSAFKCVGYPVLLKVSNDDLESVVKYVDNLLIVENLTELAELIGRLCSDYS